MTRKDLKDYKFLKIRINEKMDKHTEQFTKATKITQTLDGMPKAHNKPNYTLEDFLDASNELIKLFNEDLKKQAEIEKQLRNLNDERYYTILYLNYIENKPLEEIASTICYSYYETCRINGEALNKFDELDKTSKKTQDITKNT